ncbi:MAG: superoxide dismutase [Caldithrix sp.]|nr:superoxide dismutase [Caldithrix sp.]
MAHTLPDLPYAHDALEPYIDAQTMEIHHGKHHGGYVNKLNDALEKEAALQNQSLEDLLKKVGTLPQSVRTAVRNNGGGHWNHSFFWPVMTKNGGGQPEDDLAKAINDAFGSFDQFKEKFMSTAAGRFGSGWGWLVINPQGQLELGSTPNQDNPLMDVSDFKGRPILGVDVWEHAYYLKYQNRRPDYLEAFFNVINWAAVSEHYANFK